MQGRVRFGRREARLGMAAWMAQKDLLLPWLDVRQNVLLGARLRGERSAAIERRADALIAAAGLEAWSTKLPEVLSGGMRQRVALLRTLMETRPVILMDEPFSALDALTRFRLQALAARMVRGTTVIMVTHDPVEALRLAHRIHLLQGRPLRFSAAWEPPGDPPRRVDDPALTAMHARILERIFGAPA
jgi:putative hydroxymethylpyrimidine transport system ATP-binding protein